MYFLYIQEELNRAPGFRTCATTACLALVAGCGGGGGGQATAGVPVPPPIALAVSTPTSSTPTTALSLTTTSTKSTTSTTLSSTASSCNFPDVQAVVNRSAAGATVSIPAGDCNWGVQQLIVPGGVSLKGVHVDVTTIRRVGPISETSYLIAFDCSNGKPAILSGMTLVGNGDGAIQDNGLGLLRGCRDFKISDSKFTKFSQSAIYVGDAAGQRGVIYNNNFIDNYSADLKNFGYGVVVYGGGAWPDLELGSPNAVFVEDNYFSGNRHNIAANNGAVYVFRHNTVVGQGPARDYAMTDAHGLTTYWHGTRSYEIYDNDYSTNFAGPPQRTAVGIRGGDGVIFNNSATATISRTIELTAEGFVCGVYPGKDQIRSLYIWNNSANPGNGYTTNGIDNGCPSSIGLDRDYFLFKKPDYTPYTYPHPLRSVL